MALSTLALKFSQYFPRRDREWRDDTCIMRTFVARGELLEMLDDMGNVWTKGWNWWYAPHWLTVRYVSPALKNTIAYDLILPHGETF